MPKKRGFSWEKGARLDGDAYDPLGNVREAGFKKLADGIYADPALRKEARGKKLTKTSNQRHRRGEGEAPIRLGRLEGATRAPLIEESDSGLKEDFTPSETSEASRLIRKEAKGIKGILRFKKPEKK